MPGVKRSNLIEQLDVPDVDFEYLRDLVECPEHADFATGLPNDLLAFRIDEHNADRDIAPPFHTRWG